MAPSVPSEKSDKTAGDRTETVKRRPKPICNSNSHSVSCSSSVTRAVTVGAHSVRAFTVCRTFYDILPDCVTKRLHLLPPDGVSCMPKLQFVVDRFYNKTICTVQSLLFLYSIIKKMMMRLLLAVSILILFCAIANCILKKYRDYDLQHLGSRDVIGHVTIRLAIREILYVVNCNHSPLRHAYENIKHWTLASGNPLMVAHAHIQLPIEVLKNVQRSYVPNLMKIGR